MSETSSAPTGNGQAAAPLRRFGRFELRALLNKSMRSMLWLVFDSRSNQEMLLCMPRQAPNSPAAMEHWMSMAQAGSRVQHPNLGHVVEVGQVDQWPYLAYDRALGETLDERLTRQCNPLPLDVAQWLGQALEGLAFAHEAGHAHRDLQAAHVVMDAAGHVRVLGLEVAQEVFPANVDFNAVSRRAVRESAEEDVVCMGLLLHRCLGGRQVLDLADLHEIVQRMQPQGMELVRLPFETPHPIPAPLRAIANRATAAQERQRYHSARVFLRALDGWRAAASQEQGGPVATMIDRIQRLGHLPSTSSKLVHVAQSSSMQATHTSAVAAMILQDMALSLEMLRRVNNALRMQGSGEGTVLNMQRAIAMLGLNGVEQAARSVKQWPGVANEQNAARLRSLMQKVHRAGEISQALRPAGYDGDVVYLICVLQNLGKLLLQYHFPDDAQQIKQLMQPPEPTDTNLNPAGMTEQAAAYAVLGTDLETLGAGVARYWSLGDELLHMIRRQPADAPVRSAESDAELLRLTCSLANELVDALSGPEEKRKAGVELATRRYARVLSLGLREVMQALQPPAAAGGTVEPVARSVAVPEPAIKASALRSRAAEPFSGGGR
ncbi:HDOD domain-containing protein [Pelomonas sp. SE-A7]|uniref:serine/threonine protein kinase n=1 Tax=Pelomonas sp. SE-A7 TaxID=3054953 RepID=UPI00259D0284|nr:HDOD domain-containing protein [Pelomonas sp. SE-A7]MDM4765945.1 HDOD domain-containing protein [Pelomonas sp. SE-A7]